MAAEPSGDLQAGALARALLQRDPNLFLVGVGGRCMVVAGVDLWMESHTWSTIGPASSSLVTRCTVAPEIFTPCSQAWCCASRPGKAGSSAG